MKFNTEPDTQPLESWLHRLWAPLAVFVLAFAVRVYRLDEQSLWLDEAWIFIRIAINPDSMPNPLEVMGIFKNLTFFANRFLDLFNPVILHCISVFFGTLTPVVVYAICRSFCTNIASWIGGTCVSLSPLLITYSQDFSVYSFAVFFSTLSLYYFIKYMKHFQLKHAVYFSLSALIGMNSRPQLFFFFITLVSLSVLLHPHPRAKKISTLAIFLSIISLSFVSIIQGFAFVGEMNNTYASTINKALAKLAALDPDILQLYFEGYMSSIFNIPRTQSHAAASLIPSIASTSLASLRFLLAAVTLAATLYYTIKKHWLWCPLGIAILAFSFATGLGMVISGQLFERYLLFMQPFLVIFLLVFFSELMRSAPTRVITYTLSLFYCLYLGLISYNTAYAPRWKPPHDDAFNKIMENTGSNTDSYCVVPYFFEWPLAKYYLNESRNIVLMDSTFNFYQDPYGSLNVSTQGILDLALKQLETLKSKDAENIYIYTRRGSDLLDAITAFLEDEYSLDVIFNAEGIVVYLFKYEGDVPTNAIDIVRER